MLNAIQAEVGSGGAALDIKDFTRGDDSSMEQAIEIEQCYEEGYEEYKNPAFSFNGADSLGVPQDHMRMENVGNHLNKLHNREFGENRKSLNFVEDKWDRLF